jgi:serine/threonine protein kinase
MANWNPQANDIFLKALETHATPQRKSYLNEACGADADLRAQVESLLRASEQAGSFLQNPEPGLAPTMGEPAREAPGTLIGPYKLLQQIGEGGMGTVFMAEQTVPVQRKVAVKLIKSGMDSLQVIARFEAERQALALMDHPHIAKVLDAGATGAGRPYVVMELVKGVTITKYCDEHHLSPRERLELFIPVCQAVQHAHQKGIIHRDLKPSNVMVCLYDGKPMAKVIDFGVAKATGPKLTDRTLFTELGAVVGTFEYMSPEQAELNQLDVDTRSDIYSLGVLLYELLTGTTPLERKRCKEAAFLEVLRLIREEEPPRPSTRLSTADGLPSIAANRGLEPRKLSGLVKGELDWIAMKCLEKDRNRRYETANGLARDLQHYLDDEPVQACSPSASYKLRKLARKYRKVLGVAVAFVALLVLGVVISSLLAVRATLATTEASAQRDAATKAAARAEAISHFLTADLLGQAAPDQNARDRKITVEELLDKAAKEISTNPRLQGEPEAEASIRLTIGNTYFKLGRLQDAETHLNRAVALRRETLGAEQPDTLVAQEALAWFFCAGLRKYDAAELLSRQTWQARLRVLGPEHPDTLDSMDTYATSLMGQGKRALAEPVYRECWKTRQRTLGDKHLDTVTSLHNLSCVLIEQGNLLEGEPLLRSSMESNREQRGKFHTETVMTLGTYSHVLLLLGRPAEAELLLRDTLEGTQRVHGKDSPNALYLQHLLVRALLEQERRDEAEKLGRETLGAYRKVLPAGQERIGRSLVVLGRILVEKKNAREAEGLLREAVIIFRERYPNNHDLKAEAESWLGASLIPLARYDEAEPLLLAGYETMKSVPSIPQREKERVRANIVALYQAWGKPEKASQWTAQADR